MGKRYDCCTPRPKRDGGTFWLRIGSAWENDKGNITVFLDALPLPDHDGKAKFSLFEPREKDGAGKSGGSGGGGSFNKELDDEIPF